MGLYSFIIIFPEARGFSNFHSSYYKEESKYNQLKVLRTKILDLGTLNSFLSQCPVNVYISPLTLDNEGVK
jgi:hypothetical protein